MKQHGSTEHSSYELVRTTLVQAVGTHPATLAPGTTLHGLKRDSLALVEPALVEPALALEDRTGKPVTEVTGHSTPADVAQLIDAAGATPSVPPGRTPGPAGTVV
ncbi:hypothetical protein ACMATS_07550 [Streptoverticillium reticulum]|uniref:hypothetical protein n=1 Tax=Streptoverticillium reticulum TaxID=1433415 RepID=UPI0039BEFD6C